VRRKRKEPLVQAPLLNKEVTKGRQKKIKKPHPVPLSKWRGGKLGK